MVEGVRYCAGRGVTRGLNPKAKQSKERERYYSLESREKLSLIPKVQPSGGVVKTKNEREGEASKQAR